MSPLGPKAWDRLWEYIHVVREPDACWMWLGPIYGIECLRFNFNVGGKKQSKAARSLLFLELYGPIPEGTRVFTACDNRICMNPEHFFLAPQGYHTGANMSGSFLSLEKAREIRWKKAKNPSISYRTLGRLWGVSAGTIFKICKNEVWCEPKWPFRALIPATSIDSITSVEPQPDNRDGTNLSGI